MARIAKKAGLHLALLAAAMTLPVSIPRPAFAAPKIVIGTLFPLAGDQEASTPTLQKAVVLAAKLVQEAAGDAARLEIVNRDGKGDPTAAVDAARKLVEKDHAVVFIGPLSAEAATAVAEEIGLPSRIPLISPTATTPQFGDGNEGLMLRTAPSDAGQGAAMARVSRELGFGSAAVIYINDFYGRGLARAYQTSFTAAAGSITASVPFMRHQSSYRAELQRALADNPAVLAVIAHPDEGAVIIRQAGELSPAVRILVSHSLKDPRFASRISPWLAFPLFGTAPLPPDQSLSSSWNEAYAAAFGSRPPSPMAAAAFDAAVVAALAGIKGNGSVSASDLISLSGPPGAKVTFADLKTAVALIREGKDLDYQGVSGPLDFDAKGDVPPARYGLWTQEGETIKELRHIGDGNP